LTACGQESQAKKPPPQAVGGVIDLSDWDFEQDGSLYLSGEWLFYWDELIQPGKFDTHPAPPLVSIPAMWTEHDIEGISVTPKGYATYRLSVIFPEFDQAYGIYNEGQGSAYSLWVDGQLLSDNGLVGTSEEIMIPEKNPLSSFFDPESDHVELVVQISNFHHRKGGFRNALLLGGAETIHQFQLQNWFVEAFSVGTLTVMGLYHFFLYIFRTRNKATLYFGLLCWATALRIGVTNQSTLLIHMPSISWAAALRVEYLVFFLSPILFALFLQILYPNDLQRWFVRSVMVLGIGFALFLVFSDTFALSYTSTYYQIVFLLNIVYLCFFLVRIIRYKRVGAYYIGFASLIVFSAVIIETLILQGVIEAIAITSFLPVGQVTAISFLAFIFVQAILLASLFSRSFSRVETLSGELEMTNINLEISERKYRTLFEDSKDMIFIAGLDGQIEDVSPACQQVLGYIEDEMIQMKMMDVIVHPKDSDRFQNAIIEHGSVSNFESELRRKDGHVIHTLVSATPRRDEEEKVVGVQGNVRDITDRKKAETERLRAMKLERIAITDSLTNVYNRRFFFETAEKAIERAKRNQTSTSIILFDIDHFKNVNDTYGHRTGDHVLIELANLCQKNIRGMDLLARIGGEEFVILMPDANRQAAHDMAERLRELASKMPLAANDGQEFSITISLGVAQYGRTQIQENLPVSDLLDRADQALYRSKQEGRNRVTVWEELSGEIRDSQSAFKSRL